MLLGLVLGVALMGACVALGHRYLYRSPPPVVVPPILSPLPPPSVRVLEVLVIADRLAADPKYHGYDEPTRQQIAASIHRAAQRRIPGAKPRGLSR